jgi:hypothetical protein
MIRGRLLWYACFAVLAVNSPAGAANKIWTNAASGNFSTAGNWTGGVPLAADTATFDKAGTYTVTFNNSPANLGLFLSAGNVTFASNGGPYTYTLNSAGSDDDAILTGGSLTLGAGGTALNLNVGNLLLIHGNASMIAQAGSDINSSGLTLGHTGSAPGDGTLTIDGLGSTLTVNGTSLLGRNGETGTLTVSNTATADFNGTLGLADSSTALSTGLVHVQSGASMTTANILIAPNNANGQTGTFNVGNNVGTSTVTQDNNATLVVGAAVGPGPIANSGRLNVNAGGVFNSGGGSGTVTVNPAGRIEISGGTLNLNGNVTVDGGSISRLSGSINVAAGRTVNVRNSGRIHFGTSPALTAGTTWNIESGGDLFYQSSIDIGTSGGTTTVTVDGTGSLFELGGPGAVFTSVWGGGGSSADITVRNGGSIRMTALNLANSSTAGTTGTITVTGANSSFYHGISGDTEALVVGHATGGTGTINVLAGGSFSAATTTVNRNGQIGIDGGTLTLRGNTTINGGSITRTSGTLTVGDGKTVDVQAGGHLTFQGSYTTSLDATYNIDGAGSKMESLGSSNTFEIRNRARVNVTNGGALSGFLSVIGNSSVGTLVVDGAGSSATATQAQWANGSIANITFRNGATGSYGSMFVGRSFVNALTIGTVRVESGAQLTAGDISLADAQYGGGYLTVTGPGSSVTLGPNRVLGVGGFFDTTAAEVNVETGGSLAVGTGGSTYLQRTGRIVINGGTVDLKKLERLGGYIQFVSGSLSYIGDLTVGPGGLLADEVAGYNLDLAGRQLTLSGVTIVEQANVINMSGGTLNTGRLDIHGTVWSENGTIGIGPGGTLRVHPTGYLDIGSSIDGAVNGLGPSSHIVVRNSISLGAGTRYNGFSHEGHLYIGNHTLTLNSLNYATLGALTQVINGVVRAPNGVALGIGSTFWGQGRLEGRVVGDPGSIIEATGPLALGDAASPAGFNFGGELRVGQATVTLLSSARAGLGNLTTFGRNALPGTLNAANGYVLDFDEAVTGFGTIYSDNTLVKRAIINGAVQGTSAAQPITLSGYVKGVGSFNNVVFGGTFDPGLSPTISTVVNIAFAPTNTLIMELGGTARGSQYDAIIASGALGLDGTLQVALINGFSPAEGNSFDILDWVSVSGTFDTLQLPALAGGLLWDTSQLYTAGVLAVIGAGLAGDYNQDGRVDAADYVVWRKNNGTAQAYATWRTNFGRTAGSGALSGEVAATSVPEPSSLMLTYLLLATRGLRRARTFLRAGRAVS